MRYSSLERGFPAGSPIASALVIIVGALVIAASLVVGFLAFLVLGSVLLVLAAVVSARLWWLRRKMARDPAFRAAPQSHARPTQQTIEGEYHVVVDEKRDRRG